MDWRDRIRADSNVLVGKPVVEGTRIAVELVLDLLAAGYTPEQIRQQYDHLAPEDNQACLAYPGEIIRSERTFPVKRRPAGWFSVSARVQRPRVVDDVRSRGESHRVFRSDSRSA